MSGHMAKLFTVFLQISDCALILLMYSALEYMLSFAMSHYEREMLEVFKDMRRLLPIGALGLLVGLALAGCGGAASATAGATPTPTCPPTPQFQQATGMITAVNSTQMTVQTSTGEALVMFSTRTRYSSQQKVSQSNIQDGVRVQVVVTPNSDGTYSAVQVAIRQAATGTGNGGGGFGNGTPGPGNGTPGPGNRGGFGNGTPVPANCRTNRGGAGSGLGSSNPEGGLPSGAKVLSGTVATVSGPNITITATDGTDYNVKLASTTVYSKIATAKVTDLKIGQPVTVTGAKASNGSITALAVTILLALPTGQ
jgi:Domain of unknown function (DUF5666)